MIRKLFLLAVMALTALAFGASTASADDEGVHVENPGMFEIEGELTIAIVAHVSPTTEVAQLRCENHWEANISESGHVIIHDINVDPHAGQTGNCDGADDCDNAGWEGQIEEDEDSTDPEAFRIHTVFCLNGQGGGGAGVPFPVECAINDTEAHCDYVIVPGAGTPTSPRVEVQGELTIHPNEFGPPGFMHD